MIKSTKDYKYYLKYNQIALEKMSNNNSNSNLSKDIFYMGYKDGGFNV